MILSSIISISKLLGNYNPTPDYLILLQIISISKLLGNYNHSPNYVKNDTIISISKLLGNYNQWLVFSLALYYINISIIRKVAN